jgi:hypothetical protein
MEDVLPSAARKENLAKASGREKGGMLRLKTDIEAFNGD